MLLRDLSRPKQRFEPIFGNTEKTTLTKDKDYKTGDKKRFKKKSFKEQF